MRPAGTKKGSSGFPSALPGPPPCFKHLWMGHRALRAANGEDPLQWEEPGRRPWKGRGQRQVTVSMCLSAQGGVEGSGLSKLASGWVFVVHDLLKTCQGVVIHLVSAGGAQNAMRQGFGDPQTRASQLAETTARKLHDESSALPCQHGSVNSSPEPFVAKKCGRMGWFVTGRRSMCP